MKKKFVRTLAADRKNLVQPDNYRRGVLTPLQRRYDDVVYKGLQPYQARQNADLPYASLAVVGNVRNDPNLGRKNRHELTAGQSVYPAYQLGILSLSRIPAEALRRRRETPNARPRDMKPMRLNMLEQELYLVNNFLRLGGPVQPRRPRQYRADASPLQNLPAMEEVYWEPTEKEPRWFVQAPTYGQLSYVTTRTRDGRPWHFNIVIRNGSKDEVAFRFDPDAMPGVEMLMSEVDEGGQPRIVQKHDNIAVLCQPIRYTKRQYGSDKGRVFALDMRDVEMQGGQRRRSPGEMLRISDRPEYVELLCRMMEDMFDHANRHVVPSPMQSWAPEHLLELPWDVPQAFEQLTSEGLLDSAAFLHDMVIGVLRGTLGPDLPGLSEDAKLRLMEFNNQIATADDLITALDSSVMEVARAWLTSRLVVPGQFGYQGNGVLIPWAISTESVRARAGEHHVRFPQWTQGFHADLRAYIAPTMYHRNWYEPVVLGTLPDATAKPGMWSDYDVLRKVAMEDSFSWQLNGIFWSLRPSNGTLATQRIADEVEPRVVKRDPTRELAEQLLDAAVSAIAGPAEIISSVTTS